MTTEKQVSFVIDALAAGEMEVNDNQLNNTTSHPSSLSVDAVKFKQLEDHIEKLTIDVHYSHIGLAVLSAVVVIMVFAIRGSRN